MAFKDAAATIQAIVASAAIVVGGIWVLFLFDPFTNLRPTQYLGIEQRVSSIKFADGIVLLNIEVVIKNNMKVSAHISREWLEIQLLRPVGEIQQREINKKLRVVNDLSSTNLDEIKSVCTDQNLTIPAGGERRFPGEIFIPDTTNSGEPIQMLLIKSHFFEGNSCDLSKPHSTIAASYDIAQSPSTSPPAAR